MTINPISSPAESSHARQPWGIVAACAVLMITSSGVWYSASVFFVALLKEFGRGYAFTAGIFSVFTAVYGCSTMLVGALVDRFGARRVILVGCLLAPLALTANSLVPALEFMYVTHSILVALAVSSLGYVPVSVLLTQEFQQRRGLAISFASAGVGIGIMAVVPLTQFIIDQAGWRLAYVALALLALVLGLPVRLLELRETKPLHEQQHGYAVPGGHAILGPADRPVWTLASALRSRWFWLLTLTFTLLNGPTQLALTHQVAHLVEVGQPKSFVAGIVGLIGLVSIPGKILWGYLVDRWWVELVCLAGTACLIASLVALLVIGPATTVWGLVVYAVLMALGYAVTAAMIPVLCGRFFSGPHFGTIFGAISIQYSLGSAIGVWLAGYIHDATGSYQLAFLGSIVSAAIAAGCLWIAAPRRTQTR